MRQSRGLPLHYSLLIICEGEKTEPFFYEGLLSLLSQKGYKRNFEYIIYPFPVENKVVNGQRKGRKTRKQPLKQGDIPLPNITITGAQPLCWVNAGLEQLNTFSEVWVVYDQDSRLHNQEALNKIRDKRREGYNIHLAFSSRCFEMYLLEHYEYCYMSFEKSECNEKKDGKTHYLRCMLPECEEGSCQGDKCINGYARKHGYWKESKKAEVFQIVTNLWYGIYNSHRLKWQSLSKESINKEIFERNPYLNTYRLTLRLMEMKIIESGEEVRVEKGNGQFHIMSREKNVIRFENKSIIPLIIDVVIRVFSVDKSLDIIEEKQIREQKMDGLKLSEGDSFELKLSDYLDDHTYLKYCWEDHDFICALEDDIPNGINLSKFQVS